MHTHKDTYWSYYQKFMPPTNIKNMINIDIGVSDRENVSCSSSIKEETQPDRVREWLLKYNKVHTSILKPLVHHIPPIVHLFLHINHTSFHF